MPRDEIMFLADPSKARVAGNFPWPRAAGQLVNFLKNVAMFGGLCFVAFRAAPDAHPRVVMEHRKEEVAR